MTRKRSRFPLSKRITRDATKARGRGTSAHAVPARERAVREAQRRERALASRKAALQAPAVSMQPVAEIDPLMVQLRQVYERIIGVAVGMPSTPADAHTETAEARAEFEHLLRRLQDANMQLVAASTKARTLEQQARQREEYYRRLLGKLLRVQDDERHQIALDLHNSTSQRLAALSMNLSLFEGAKGGLDVRLRRALANSRALAAQCAHEVGTLACQLHPPLLDEMGLLPAVRWYVAGFTERSGIQVDLELDEIDRLPGPKEMALFRVVQESLTNVHRHAGCSTACVRLTRTSRAVTLEIQDRGRGLHDDLKQGTRAGALETLGVGIQGMRERIHQVGGTFDVAFTDIGTTVRVRVPLHESLS